MTSAPTYEQLLSMLNNPNAQVMTTHNSKGEITGVKTIKDQYRDYRNDLLHRIKLSEIDNKENKIKKDKIGADLSMSRLKFYIYVYNKNKKKSMEAFKLYKEQGEKILDMYLFDKSSPPLCIFNEITQEEVLIEGESEKLRRYGEIIKGHINSNKMMLRNAMMFDCYGGGYWKKESLYMTGLFSEVLKSSVKYESIF
ncbi:MAG: hypothetical protein ACI9YE_000474 [Psychroserpens sp.]|jgi:hypothetical protein